MPFWLKALVILALVGVLLLYALGADWRTAADLIVLAGALAPSVVQKTPSLYFAWTRLRYRVTNVATTWNLGVRLTGEFSSENVERFARTLAADTQTSTRILEVASDRVLIHYHRLFTIEFLLSAPEPDFGVDPAALNSLTVSVLDQQVSYRRSTTMMEDSLIPFIEKLQTAFPASEVLYSLRVRFEDVNPFFGLYVQQLRKELITDFRFEFHLPSALPREYVRVGKDQLVIVSSSLERFRRAVNAGLTFTVVTA